MKKIAEPRNSCSKKPPLSQREALERFLSGPLLKLTDENGKAPSRDQTYDRRDRFLTPDERLKRN